MMTDAEVKKLWGAAGAVVTIYYKSQLGSGSHLYNARDTKVFLGGYDKLAIDKWIAEVMAYNDALKWDHTPAEIDSVTALLKKADRVVRFSVMLRTHYDHPKITISRPYPMYLATNDYWGRITTRSTNSYLATEVRDTQGTGVNRTYVSITPPSSEASISGFLDVSDLPDTRRSKLITAVLDTVYKALEEYKNTAVDCIDQVEQKIKRWF